MNLDLVFYQSRELLSIAADFLKTTPERLESSGRHTVLSRGIIGPQSPPGEGVRAEVRQMLGISQDDVLVLYLGRITYEKGLFGLVDIFARNSEAARRMRLVMVGSQPGFDASEQLTARLRCSPTVGGLVHVLPACSPTEIWSYFKAADIFAFPSLKEGMPNSLLEAMISGLPAVTFDIPAIQDLVRYDKEALFAVEAFDYQRFLQTLLLLSKDRHLRRVTGIRGKELVEDHFSLAGNMKLAIEGLGTVTRRALL